VHRKRISRKAGGFRGCPPATEQTLTSDAWGGREVTSALPEHAGGEGNLHGNHNKQICRERERIMKNNDC